MSAISHGLFTKHQPSLVFTSNFSTTTSGSQEHNGKEQTVGNEQLEFANYKLQS
jgi:hypothetical protein